MKILAIDSFASDVMLETRIWNPNAEVHTTITCKLSNLHVDDLDDPDLQIRVRHGIMKSVPRRKNKRKRIQKKWIKRYGMRQVVDYYEKMYKVNEMHFDFQHDTVEFECELISTSKYSI